MPFSREIRKSFLNNGKPLRESVNIPGYGRLFAPREDADLLTPILNRLITYPSSERTNDALHLAKRHALQHNHVAIDTGDILIGLLSVPREEIKYWDLKDARFYQEFVPVNGEKTLIENPCQQEQIAQAENAIDQAIEEKAAFFERTHSGYSIDVMGVDFSDEAYYVLQIAEQERRNTGFSRLETFHILTALVANKYTTGSEALLRILREGGGYSSRNLRSLSPDRRVQRMREMIQFIH